MVLVWVCDEFVESNNPVRPYYSIKVVRYFDQQELTDFENEFDEDDTISENRHVTKKARVMRAIISILLTLICLGISAFLTFFLVIVSENVLGTIRYE